MTSGDRVEALFCSFCKTLEEIPDSDYDGPRGENPIVAELLMRHNQRDPQGHGWGDGVAPFALFDFDPDEWANQRERCIKIVNERLKKSGNNAWVAEAMNTFGDDALKCYRQHGRPTGGCTDYWSDSKRIGRPTSEGKTVLKQAPKLGAKDPHLCQWCPVHTYVTTERRAKAGMYKER